MRMLSVLLSVAVAMSPVLAAAKTIKNSRPASERFLNQAVTAYKKHAKVADVLKHMLPKKRTAADKAYLKKVFGKHMNQVLPKVHHEGNKFWFVLSDKKKVTVEVVNVRQGKFKINGYEARVDFKKKSLKENVNYIGRIIEKDLAKEKTAMERFYRLVFPESHAFVMFGFLITPYAAGVLAAITAGVSGAAYAAYRAFQDEADRFEDHLDDMKVTQASMTCSNPTGSSQQKCRDHIGTEGPAYELKILRDKKEETYLICSSGMQLKNKFNGSYFRRADDDQDGEFTVQTFGDASSVKAHANEHVSEEEMSQIALMVGHAVYCCRQLGDDCADEINDELPMYGNTEPTIPDNEFSTQ